jgi:hypothetical protein
MARFRNSKIALSHCRGAQSDLTVELYFQRLTGEKWPISRLRLLQENGKC